MLARSLLVTLASSLSLFGAAGVADAHRPSPILPQAQVDLQLLCDGGRCDEVHHRGTRYVVGEQGQRYEIALTNRSDRWVEAVVTVDGRNIVDGDRTSSRSRGYLLAPYASVNIEGWRVSSAQVAAFRFTSVGDSYAGRVGDARLAGTVRMDVYPERRDVAVFVPPHRGWSEDDDRRPVPREDKAAAPRASGSAADSETSRWRREGGQNLGTEFGESRWQPVDTREFVRADPHRPSQVVTLSYDDRRGLIARGVLNPPRWIEPEPWATLPKDEHWVEPPPPRAW